MSRVYTLTEFRQAVRADDSTVRRWIRSGKVTPGRTPGGHYRFTQDQVDLILAPKPAPVPHPASNTLAQAQAFIDKKKRRGRR